MNDRFHKYASLASEAVGRSWAFLTALAVVVTWALTGPLFHFSDTWQLVINTGTTIITFLMVFLIQNTQNRDAKAIHLKLDELIRANAGARNNLIDLENLSDAELEALHGQFRALATITEPASGEPPRALTTAADPADPADARPTAVTAPSFAPNPLRWLEHAISAITHELKSRSRQSHAQPK